MKACCRRRGIEDRASATDFFAVSAPISVAVSYMMEVTPSSRHCAAVARPDPRRPEEPAAAPAAASRAERRAAAWPRWRTGPSHLRPSPARPEQRRQRVQPEHHHFASSDVWDHLLQLQTMLRERTSQDCLKLQKSKCRKKFANMLPEHVVNGIKADAKVILHDSGRRVGFPDITTIAKIYNCSGQTVLNVLSGKPRRRPGPRTKYSPKEVAGAVHDLPADLSGREKARRLDIPETSFRRLQPKLETLMAKATSCKSSAENCSCEDCKCCSFCSKREACRGCGCPPDKCSRQGCNCAACASKKESASKEKPISPTKHASAQQTSSPIEHLSKHGTSSSSEHPSKHESSTSSSGLKHSECASCGSPGGQCKCVCCTNGRQQWWV